VQRWAEFLSRPAKPISAASRGRLEGQEVRIVEDRGVLQTCGEGREDGNWLRLEEAAYMLQRELLSIEGADIDTLFRLMDKRIPAFALYSYLRRCGLIPRPAAEGLAVYSASGFSKRRPGPALYTVVPVGPKDQVQPSEEKRAAVVEQGRVLRVLEFIKWEG
jgi:hypothetical protein